MRATDTDIGGAPSAGRLLLRSIVTDRRRALAGASALFVSHQVGELMVPVVAGQVIDRAVVTGDSGALVRWVIVLVATFACLSTSWRWADRTLTRLAEQSAHELRLRLTERILAHEGITGGGPVGRTVSVASSDVDGTVKILVAVVAAAASLGATTTAAVVLLWISVPLGLVVVIGLPPVLGLIHLLAAPIEARVAAQQADVGRAAATATDLIAGLRVVKGLGAEREAAERYRRASRRSLSAALRTARLYAAHDGLTTGVTGVFVAVVALVGGRFAADGRISVGELVAAVGVTQFLVGPLGRAGYAAAMRSAARASADRVVELLDAPAAVVDGVAPADVEGAGRLTVRAVGHGPLTDVDLTIEPGTFVAVASAPGEAAALAELLGRRSDPERGALALDGTPFRALALDELRAAVVVAEHDAALFSGSVRENIGTDRGRMTDVLAAVAADELEHTLPAGLDTPVSERGRSLSGGQRQRVALARALCLEPKVLVVHEPTTAIDAVTEAHIAGGLRRLRGGTTTVAITTSLTLLSVADRVVFVEGGRVTADGTHAELLATEPAYAEMVTR